MPTMARLASTPLLGEIRHRFSDSFELSAQYRLSESLDDGSNNFATDHYQYDPGRHRMRRRTTT